MYQFNSLFSALTLQTVLGLEVWGLGFSFWLCGKDSTGSLNSTWNRVNSYDPAVPIPQFPQNLSSRSLTSFWLYVLTNKNVWLNCCFSSLVLPIWQTVAFPYPVLAASLRQVGDGWHEQISSYGPLVIRHPFGPWLSGLVSALAMWKWPFHWSQLHGLHIPTQFHYSMFYSTDKAEVISLFHQADLANIKWADVCVSMAWSPSVSSPPWIREKAEGLSSLSLLMMFLWQVWTIRRYLSKKDQQWLLHHQLSPLGQGHTWQSGHHEGSHDCHPWMASLSLMNLWTAPLGNWSDDCGANQSITSASTYVTKVVGSWKVHWNVLLWLHPL